MTTHWDDNYRTDLYKVPKQEFKRFIIELYFEQDESDALKYQNNVMLLAEWQKEFKSLLKRFEDVYQSFDHNSHGYFDRKGSQNKDNIFEFLSKMEFDDFQNIDMSAIKSRKYAFLN